MTPKVFCKRLLSHYFFFVLVQTLVYDIDGFIMIFSLFIRCRRMGAGREAEGDEAMSGEQSYTKVDMIQKTLGNPLGSGEMGIVLARAGAGKTACLTHIALEGLLRGSSVLHVCVGDAPEKAKAWYQELLRNVSMEEPAEDLAALQSRVEPLRFILSYLQQIFSLDKLEQSVGNLKAQGNFHPAMVVLDGLDFDRIDPATVEGLRDFAQRHQVAMWLSARTHRHIATTNERGVPYPCHEIDGLFHAILLMEPGSTGTIEVKTLKKGNCAMSGSPPVFVNAQTFLVKKH